MQVTRVVVLAAAVAARALASSPHVDITHEMRGLGDPLVLAARATASAAAVGAAGAAGNKNLQTFTGALGGIKAAAVSSVPVIFFNFFLPGRGGLDWGVGVGVGQRGGGVVVIRRSCA